MILKALMTSVFALGLQSASGPLATPSPSGPIAPSASVQLATAFHTDPRATSSPSTPRTTRSRSARFATYSPAVSVATHSQTLSGATYSQAVPGVTHSPAVSVATHSPAVSVATHSRAVSVATRSRAVPVRRYSQLRAPAVPQGIHKIQHVVMIMQENRSFDEYFGTYPGAEGIPTKEGVPIACVPDPQLNACIAPYHNTKVVNGGGPHGLEAMITDVDGGAMDGFIKADEESQEKSCTNVNNPACAPGAADEVMGYHTAEEIPNYWAYAKNFVLQDHMFASDDGWSLPEHLFDVSAWSATCVFPTDPLSCTSAPQWPANAPEFAAGVEPVYPWTDVTYLLHKHHVSWAYYVFAGEEPDCDDDDAIVCTSPSQSAKHSRDLEPAARLQRCSRGRGIGNIQSLNNFYAAAAVGELPAVSWIVPNNKVSEHPPSSITVGPGVRDHADQHDHARPGLGQHGDLHLVG